MRSVSRSGDWKRNAAPTLAIAAMLIAACAGAAEPEKDKSNKKEPSRAELQQQLDAAQKRLDEAAREVANLSMSLSDEMVPYATAMATRVRERAVLGINIGGAASDREDGVEVQSVSPGGPAEAAGLKAGDVLTQIGGKQLKREGETSAREKLLATLREAKPGDKLAVSYRRDGKIATTTVTTESMRNQMFTMAMPRDLPKLEAMPHLAFSYGAFGSAELAPLTPKLGQYFGTDKGLLVVRAPDDTRLQLEDGDVILDIDGRVPTSPTHALRILGSYQAGEKLKVNLLRMKKRMAIDITMPEPTRSKGRERARVVPYGQDPVDVLQPAPVGVWTAPVPLPAPAPEPPSPARAGLRGDGPV